MPIARSLQNSLESIRGRREENRVCRKCVGPCRRTDSRPHHLGLGLDRQSKRTNRAATLFLLRLVRFWDYQFIVRRGGIGRIESSGHVADGLWLFFALRAWGGFDLETRPGRCNYCFSIMSRRIRMTTARRCLSTLICPFATRDLEPS